MSRGGGKVLMVHGDPQVRRFFPRTLTAAEVFADLDAAKEKSRLHGFHVQAAELKGTGDLIGLIGLSVIPEKTRAAIPSHPRVEIGWVLAAAFWNRVMVQTYEPADPHIPSGYLLLLHLHAFVIRERRLRPMLVQLIFSSLHYGTCAVEMPSIAITAKKSSITSS